MTWTPTFDDEKGLGSVPHNMEVDYFGWRAMMRPSEFLALNPSRGTALNGLLERMAAGEPIGHPFLSVRKEEPGGWRVVSHEGRGRMLAMLALGYDEPIEVHIFPLDGLRAKHITEADKALPFLKDVTGD